MSVIKLSIPRVRNFRKIYDSEKNGMMYSATCPIMSIFSVKDDVDKVLGINPRNQKMTSLPSKAMQETLRDDQDTFVFRNRGLTFIAQDVAWDNKSETLEITCQIDEAMPINGLADGAHSYEVIKKFISETDAGERKEITAEIRLDIIAGFGDRIDEILALVDSRNQSTPIRYETQLNYKGVFQPIEDSLASQKYANEIAYYENQLVDEKNPAESEYRTINISSVLSYLMCFDLEQFRGNDHPISAYSSKKKVLQWFAKRCESDMQDTIALVKLLPQILELRDYIESKIERIWNQISGRLVDQPGVRKLEKPESLDFSDYQVNYSIPGGFIYPILSAFRSILVKKDSEYKFLTNPKNLFDKMNTEKERSLVSKLVAVIKEVKNPNAMGKSLGLYDSCYESLSAYYWQTLNQ